MTEARHAVHQQPEMQFSDVATAASAPGLDLMDATSLRVQGSMLWAAYGDALGFVSELTDRKGLQRRTQGRPLDRLMAWRRRVGGRQGVEVELPQGCWSDDTQLRMAVSRSVSHRGFDVETFARIELPVWPSYALGGGRASKTAAKNLGKPRTSWYANTFPGWFNAGGNGAAMRIQPHVWASTGREEDFLLDVISDSVCTHGHPRAIVGACFHAATLAHCMRHGFAPDLDKCCQIAAGMEYWSSALEAHSHLGSTWVKLWQEAAGMPFTDGWRTAVGEVHQTVSDAQACLGNAKSTEAVYRKVVDRLGLADPRQRGSGILTTVAAAALASVARDPHEAVVAAADAVDTDTDTIATMAGAMLGACDSVGLPPEMPLDGDYLKREALRLAAVGRGESGQTHTYPDILTWTAPKAQADALVRHEGRLVVEGLGPVKEISGEAARSADDEFGWQWVMTDFGQTLLIKRRPSLRELTEANALEAPPAKRKTPVRRESATAWKAAGGSTPRPLDRGVCVDDAIDHARKHITEDNAVGYTVRRVARDGTIADLAALVTALRDDLRC